MNKVIVGLMALVTALAGCSTIPTRESSSVVKAESSAPAACPLRRVNLRMYRPAAMELPGVAQTHAIEERGQKFSSGAHVSSDHFDTLLKSGLRSTTPHRIQVSFINTPEATSWWGRSIITQEKIVQRDGQTSIPGPSYIDLTVEDAKDWNAVRVVFLDSDVDSPPKNRDTQLHELRVFNQLPGNDQGEWKKTDDCKLGLSAIAKKR